LTAANIITNPSDWNNSLNVSFDPTTNILSLTGDGNNDYQIITVTLSNLLFNVGGQGVTGITPISTGNAVIQSASDVFTTTPFFTPNSFGVTYSVTSFATFPPEFLIQAQTDTFQVLLGSVAVPEPGTLGLMGIGFGTLLLARRRKKA
jgi:succinate-acetate transporter protein